MQSFRQKILLENYEEEEFPFNPEQKYLDDSNIKELDLFIVEQTVDTSIFKYQLTLPKIKGVDQETDYFNQTLPQIQLSPLDEFRNSLFKKSTTSRNRSRLMSAITAASLVPEDEETEDEQYDDDFEALTPDILVEDCEEELTPVSDDQIKEYAFSKNIDIKAYPELNYLAVEGCRLSNNKEEAEASEINEFYNTKYQKEVSKIIKKKAEKELEEDIEQQEAINEIRQIKQYHQDRLVNSCGIISLLKPKLQLNKEQIKQNKIDPKEISCPICLEDEMVMPCTLPCSHHFCCECIEQVFDERSIFADRNCPLCREVVDEDYEVEIDHDFNKKMKCIREAINNQTDKAMMKTTSFSSSKLRKLRGFGSILA